MRRARIRGDGALCGYHEQADCRRSIGRLGLRENIALGLGFVHEWNSDLPPVRRYSTRRAAQPSARTRQSNQRTLVSFCAMGSYPSSGNSVRVFWLAICEVAKSRILRLFWGCVFRNGHSEFARPSRTHISAVRNTSVGCHWCELSALSQTTLNSWRFTDTVAPGRNHSPVGRTPVCRITGQLLSA